MGSGCFAEQEREGVGVGVRGDVVEARLEAFDERVGPLG
jgi:hypothetical protein